MELLTLLAEMLGLRAADLTLVIFFAANVVSIVWIKRLTKRVDELDTKDEAQENLENA